MSLNSRVTPLLHLQTDRDFQIPALKKDITVANIPEMAVQILKPFTGVIEYKNKLQKVRLEYDISDRMVFDIEANLFC